MFDFFILRHSDSDMRRGYFSTILHWVTLGNPDQFAFRSANFVKSRGSLGSIAEEKGGVFRGKEDQKRERNGIKRSL